MERSNRNQLKAIFKSITRLAVDTDDETIMFLTEGTGRATGYGLYKFSLTSSRDSGTVRSLYSYWLEVSVGIDDAAMRAADYCLTFYDE